MHGGDRAAGLGVARPDGAVDHVGLDGAGGDRVDTDAEAGRFQRGRLGQAFDGVLARDVSPAALQADMAGDRAHVDDGASARATQRGELMLQEPEDPLGVHAQGPAHIGRSLLLEAQGLVSLRAGVVDRDVQTAEGFHRRADREDGAGFFGLVGDDVTGLAARGLDGGEQRRPALRPQVGEHEAAAQPREGEGGGLADAGCGAGDQDDGSAFHVRDYPRSEAGVKAPRQGRIPLT